MKTSAKEKRLQDLLARHGEVIGGAALALTLGFPSYGAMKQAVHRGTLTIPTFFIQGRRGRFALTADVSEWLESCRISANNAAKIKIPEGFNGQD